MEVIVVKTKASSSTRGIVHAKAGKEKFNLIRFDPCALLQPFIEHYWYIDYHLSAEETHTQKVLSYPNFHLAFEQDHEGSRGLLYGIPKHPFIRKLQGEGRVLGVKFRAGGQYPYYSHNAALLTGKTLDITEAFGSDAGEWMNSVLEAKDATTMASLTESYLLLCSPKRDKLAELTESIVQLVENDRNLITVEQVSEHSGLSIRQLQRLFQKYVGVTPKWVIKRFRLQEAAEAIEQDEQLQWTELALQLGYYDQAHFIKDFKSVVGQSPVEYRKQGL